MHDCKAAKHKIYQCTIMFTYLHQEVAPQDPTLITNLWLITITYCNVGQTRELPIIAQSSAFHIFKYINIRPKRVQHSLSTFYAYMSTCVSRDFPCSRRLAKKQGKCMKFWFLIRFTSCLRISRWSDAMQKNMVWPNHRHSVERKIEKKCENKPAMLDLQEFDLKHGERDAINNQSKH